MYAVLPSFERENWTALAQAFTLQGFQPPDLKWEPHEEDLEVESLKHAFAYWDALRCGADVPRYRFFTPESLHPYLGWATVLEPNADVSDFRYRIYGTWPAPIG